MLKALLLPSLASSPSSRFSSRASNNIKGPSLMAKPNGSLSKLDPLTEDIEGAAKPCQTLTIKGKEEEETLIAEKEQRQKEEEEERLSSLLGPPPYKPLPGDCCGSGCVRCVWDTYYDELEEYNSLKQDLLKNPKS